MSNLNLVSMTVAIISNYIINNDEKNNTAINTILLEPICLTQNTFKKCFFPCNSYSPSEFVDISKFNYYTVKKKDESIPLSLYTESLRLFMSYNNISLESEINPKLLIEFSNDISKFNNFKDIPNVTSSMSWVNINKWLNKHQHLGVILSLQIEFHYYNKYFMPEPVKYIFRYYIC